MFLLLDIQQHVFTNIWKSHLPRAGSAAASADPIDFAPLEVPDEQLVLGDDQVSGPLELGFDFPFFWALHDVVYVSSNGWLAFARAARSPTAWSATSRTRRSCCTSRGFSTSRETTP